MGFFSSFKKTNKKIPSTPIGGISSSELEKESKTRKFLKKFDWGLPDRYNFTIDKRKDMDGVSIIKVRYPNCQNYEGTKILVYESKKELDKLLEKKDLDPHFVPDKTSPIARFEPTERGWILAEGLAVILNRAREKMGGQDVF